MPNKEQLAFGHLVLSFDPYRRALYSYVLEQRSIASFRRCLMPSVIRPIPIAEAMASNVASESRPSQEIALAKPINSTSGMSFKSRISSEAGRKSTLLRIFTLFAGWKIRDDRC